MTIAEVERINDQRLVEILREKGMDVVFRPQPPRSEGAWRNDPWRSYHRYDPTWGCVAGPNSTFEIESDPSGFNNRIFKWTGMIPDTPEELAAAEIQQQQELAAANFLNFSGTPYVPPSRNRSAKTAIPAEPDRVRVVRLED